MYESPQLQLVGSATAVIQGIVAIGGDFMGQSENSPIEYSQDD